MKMTKFTFDTVFTAEKNIVSDAHTKRRRALSDAEVEALCAAAKAEGATVAEVRALEAIAAATQETTRTLEQVLANLVADRLRMREEAAQLALVCARKMAHAALAAFPAAEVETVLREAMHQAIGEPRIVLKAAPEVAAALAPRVAEIAHEEGFDGRVQISADPQLRRADCRVEWRGGGTERAEATIESAIESLITRNLQNSADTEEGTAHGE